MACRFSGFQALGAQAFLPEWFDGDGGEILSQSMACPGGPDKIWLLFVRSRRYGGYMWFGILLLLIQAMVYLVCGMVILMVMVCMKFTLAFRQLVDRMTIHGEHTSLNRLQMVLQSANIIVEAYGMTTADNFRPADTI